VGRRQTTTRMPSPTPSHRSSADPKDCGAPTHDCAPSTSRGRAPLPACSARWARGRRTHTPWATLTRWAAPRCLSGCRADQNAVVRAASHVGQRVSGRAHLSKREWAAALAHVWPLLAFIVGVTLASHIKSGRLERVVPHSLCWTMGVQAVALAIIGFVPSSVPYSTTVPISFLAAVQIGLFRNIRPPRLPARRDHGQHDAVRRSRVGRIRRETAGLAKGLRCLWLLDRRVRLRRGDRRRCQPGVGPARHLVARGISGQYALPVHR
jgi:hypothetical protein